MANTCMFTLETAEELVESGRVGWYNVSTDPIPSWK